MDSYLSRKDTDDGTLLLCRFPPRLTRELTIILCWARRKWRLEEIVELRKIITRASLSGFLAIGILTAGSHVVSAQQSNMCTSRTAMKNALEGKYQEQRKGFGVASEVGVMEFFVSASGSWTVIMSMANGMSCIIAAGKDWQDMKPEPAGINS